LFTEAWEVIITSKIMGEWVCELKITMGSIVSVENEQVCVGEEHEV
jgi:hypothetical protein